ncbi:MAG: ABC transporter permease [Clostridia bacterium]|nr:ABC transporter permease [Clostridia bacterium]
MWRIATKVFFASLILLTITYATFFLTDLQPRHASYSKLIYTGRPTSEIEAFKEEQGLNDPVNTKYIRWLNAAKKGDLGTYYDRNKPVTEYLPKFMGRSFLLNGVAFIVAISISIPLGVLSAIKERKWSDYVVMVLTMIFTSVPSFYFGLLTILWVARKMPGLLPISGMGTTILVAKGYPSLWVQIFDVAHHMILPVASIGLVWIGTLTPFVRSAMLEVIHQDYVRTAKSKGLSNYKVFFKHTLRNALVPFISILAMLIPNLIISNIFVEQVFSWPGMGWLYINSIWAGESEMVIAITLCYAIMVLIGNFVADALYMRTDARLKGGAH